MVRQDLDLKQLILIGAVVITIAYFVSVSAFATFAAVTPRTAAPMDVHCFDTDGDSPGTAGAVAILELPRGTPVAANFLSGITDIRDSDWGPPITRTVLFQPPGVTGNGVLGKYYIYADDGLENITPYVPPTTQPSETGTGTSNVTDAVVSSAVLIEKLCPTVTTNISSSVVSPRVKNYLGNSLDHATVVIPVNQVATTGRIEAFFLK